jgi:type II secretory pathway predicted ATPase ExeA
VILFKPSVVGMEENDTKGKTLKSADVLHAIVARLQPDLPMPQTVQARTLRAKKLLTASASMGNTHLLVVEEAHSMPDATLKHLKRLHELREGRRSLLGILLLAQPELKRRLADGLRDGTLREVAQRCEVVELLPLDGDIEPYLARRAEACNVALHKLIDKGGIQQIRERLTRRLERGAVSMCYPLAVSNLMVMSLNAAAAIGAPIVTADIVKSA